MPLTTILLALLASSPLQAASPAKRVRAMIQEGSWLSAREFADDLRSKGGFDPEAADLVKGMESLVASDAVNADFDPRRYFYAQGYLAFFQDKRYADAVEAFEQVLTFELENVEVLRFMDKASALAEEESRSRTARQKALLSEASARLAAGDRAGALTLAERGVAVDPGSVEGQGLLGKVRAALEAPPVGPGKDAKGKQRPAAAKAASVKAAAAAPASLPPADPAWLESRYRAALKAYVGRDVAKSVAILGELTRRDPGTERWQKALDRISKELPPNR